MARACDPELRSDCPSSQNSLSGESETGAEFYDPPVPCTDFPCAEEPNASDVRTEHVEDASTPLQHATAIFPLGAQHVQPTFPGSIE